MYQYHPAPTGDRSDSILNPKKPTYPPYNPEAPIDSSVLINDTITSGWNGPLCLLLINGIISLLWGIALAIFSSGIVPVAWTISQYGKGHPEVTNVLVTLIGTASTTHLKYIFQGILQQYSHYVLVNGFTLRQLTWMQGIKEWSLSTAFGSQKKRSAWLAIYAGMALHSASVVSILQPNTFYKHVPFNDPIPCAADPNSLSLNVADNLSPDTQSKIDQLSFGIGLQLGNYIEQVGGNTTTSVAGRVYVKDDYAYGAVGGLENGLQEIPGVMFIAQCTNDPNTSSLLNLWGSVFPGSTPPTISEESNGSQSFSNQSIPSQMRSIVSDPSFNLTGSQVGMYALVNSSGSGGLLMVNATGGLLCCIWQAAPKLVSVQTVNFTAQSLGSQDSKTVPQLTGRAVLLTLQGMAEAVHLGASLDDSDLLVQPPIYKFAPTTEVLQTLLADGGKAALTSYNVYFRSLFAQGQDPAGVSACDSNNRTVAGHWKFGNNHNLGWLAVIWTTGMGILAIVAVIWFTKRPRMQEIKPLEVAYAFVLGRVVVVDGMKEGSQVLSIRNVRLEKASAMRATSVSKNFHSISS